MKSKVGLLLLGAALTYAGFCYAEEDRVSAGGLSYIMCRQQKDVRTIRVSSASRGSCVTTYTKEGLDQEIARSSRKDLCAEVLTKVKANLEKANWKCKDISNRSSVSEQAFE